MTVSDYIQSEAINPRTARRRIAKSGQPFLLKAEATMDIQAILSGQIKVTKINGHDRTCDTDTRTQDRTEIRTTDTRTKGQKDTRTADKARTFDGHFLRTDTFLFLSLAVGMLGQMTHTAGFFFINSPITEPTALRLALAILFAAGTDCTALVMTVHRGGKGYLIAFALIHFALNITFHAQVHKEPTWGAIFGYVLLSGVISFANFSFTDLFSRK